MGLGAGTQAPITKTVQIVIVTVTLVRREETPKAVILAELKEPCPLKP